MERVQFMTSEDGLDLIVSFVVPWDPGGDPDCEDVRSLILLRTPKFEFALDDNERGVSFSDEGRDDDDDERELLREIEFGAGTVTVKTTRRAYDLDVSHVDEKEIEEAKRILKKMNFDDRFMLTIL